MHVWRKRQTPNRASGAGCVASRKTQAPTRQFELTSDKPPLGTRGAEMAIPNGTLMSHIIRVPPLGRNPRYNRRQAHVAQPCRGLPRSDRFAGTISSPEHEQRWTIPPSASDWLQPAQLGKTVKTSVRTHAPGRTQDRLLSGEPRTRTICAKHGTRIALVRK